MIYHQSVVSEIQCEDLCLRIPRCLAYNYQYSGKHDENERACELMNSVVDVKSSVGFSFRLFERNRANKVRREVIVIEILLLEFRRGAFRGSFPVYFSCFSFVGLFTNLYCSLAYDARGSRSHGQPSYNHYSAMRSRSRRGTNIDMI